MRHTAEFLLFLLVILLGSVQLPAEDAVLSVQATAPSYRQAIADALQLAVEQHCGVHLNATELHSLQQGITIQDEKGQTTCMTAVSQELLQTYTRGHISGFNVLRSKYNPMTKQHRVKLEVRIPGRYLADTSPQNRRMAIMPFRMEKESFSLLGHAIPAKQWCRSFENALTVQFTQSRRFTMLDRSYDKDVQQELQRYWLQDGSPLDIGRLSQRLLTDYLLVGTIRFLDTAAPAENPFTGETMPAAAPFAEIHCRLLLAPTGQLKWADTIRLDANRYLPATVEDFLSYSAEDAAWQVAEKFLRVLHPFHVAGITEEKLVILDEGGKSLIPGELLEVIEGTENRDNPPAAERRIATVLIKNVTETNSYACVQSGDVSQILPGMLLRRLPAPPEPNAQIPSVEIPTTVRSSEGGGVIVPF